jgi:hypothetical protein
VTVTRPSFPLSSWNLPPAGAGVPSIKSETRDRQLGLSSSWLCSWDSRRVVPGTRLMIDYGFSRTDRLCIDRDEMARRQRPASCWSPAAAGRSSRHRGGSTAEAGRDRSFVAGGGDCAPDRAVSEPNRPPGCRPYEGRSMDPQPRVRGAAPLQNRDARRLGRCGGGSRPLPWWPAGSHWGTCCGWMRTPTCSSGFR